MRPFWVNYFEIIEFINVIIFHSFFFSLTGFLPILVESGQTQLQQQSQTISFESYGFVSPFYLFVGFIVEFLTHTQNPDVA